MQKPGQEARTMESLSRYGSLSSSGTSFGSLWVSGSDRTCSRNELKYLKAHCLGLRLWLRALGRGVLSPFLHRTLFPKGTCAIHGGKDSVA